jgi:NADPH-dependent glutamate synthase beta subunit-like oxidoreductase
MSDDNVYSKLQKHLNTFKPGAPESEAILGILRIRFTPEEAEAALILGPAPRSLSELVQSSGRDREALHTILEQMADKALVYKQTKTKDGVTEEMYRLFPTAVGLWETSFAKGERNPTQEKLGHYWQQYYVEGWGEEMVSQGIPFLRVIPVATSIAPDREIYSYEKASELLKKWEYICVLHCPCRMSAALDGKGCGKPTETCFHFGNLAKFFVEKGFAREVTQQEALEILDMTDKAGLIHSVVNAKEMGVSMCSCCTCCCTQYRAVEEFGRPMAVEKSRFAAEVDVDKCLACRRCEQRCMPSAFSLKEVKKEGDGDRHMPPCEEACPAGINVPGYVALIGAGRELEAYNLILKNNPFPAVCGRVCTHPCELQCTRNKVDKSVAIRHLKRYITDTVFENYTPEAVKALPKNGKSVGIIGAGPSGLSCGYYLSLLGYDVDVYESQPIAGGVLAYGIPEYRIPRAVLEKEIKMIEKAGVKIHLNTEIGKDVHFDQLRKKHNALYIAIGTQSSKMAGIPGEDLSGVHNGLDFLRAVSLGNAPEVGKKVVVIGGGNVAVDTALTALRKGAQKVSIVCLEQRNEMPAFEEDILEALEDGIELINGFGPRRFLGSNGKVSAVEFMRCTRVFDENGAFVPIYDPADSCTLESDTVIVSIGQAPDLSFAEGLSTGGRLAADPITHMTSMEGVFAGGDLVRGSNVAIAAIADGKNTARSIDIYLGGKGELNTGIEVDIPEPDLTVLPYLGDRYPLERLDKSIRVCSFDEVVQGYSRENAIGEAKRCLRCDKRLREFVDQQKCMGCGLCVAPCPGEAISLKERESYQEPVTTIKEFVAAQAASSKK